MQDLTMLIDQLSHK